MSWAQYLAACLLGLGAALAAAAAWVVFLIAQVAVAAAATLIDLGAMTP